MYEGSILKNSGSGGMEDAKCKRVAIAVVEDDLTDSSLMVNIASLAEYPRITHRQYVINKTEQQNAIWNDMLGARGKISFKKENRISTIEAALHWFGNLLLFIALIFSYSKDTLTGSSVLRTTILELLFSVSGILVSCYKQWRAWGSVTSANEAISTEPNGIRNSNAVHMNGFIITSNLAGCALICSGFTLLLLFDRSEYTFLKSTMYFTGLTIFALMIVDNVIMNKMSEGRAIVEQDQFKLLIHELKEELFEELQLSNKYERVKTLRDYIEKFDAFKLKSKGYIYPI